MTTLFLTGTCHYLTASAEGKYFPSFFTTALPTPSSSAVKQINWHIVLSYLLLLNNFKKFISSKESCTEIPGNTFALQTNYLLVRVFCLVVA